MIPAKTVMDRMTEVSESMWDLARLMSAHNDTDPYWVRHTEELKGASSMLLSWVVDIQREINEEERVKE